MKRAKVVDKRIVTSLINHLGVGTDVDVLHTFTYPGTIFGLHYEMTAYLDNAISEQSIFNVAIYLLQDGVNNPTMNLPGTGSRLMNQGDERGVLVSHTLFPRRILLVDTSLVVKDDKVSGHIKTERKVHAGDKLVIISRGDATLGTSLISMLTYWIRS